MATQTSTKQSRSEHKRRKPIQEPTKPNPPKIVHKQRKKAYVIPTVVPVVEYENLTYENPLIVESVEMHPALTESAWDNTAFDYVPDNYDKPQQRKRRKHKEPTEQYRKESKWQ